MSVSDKTGLVVEINGNKIIPAHVLADGDGKQATGFKAEWATVKENDMYVGSTGKEFVSDGKIVNNNSLWVKVIEKDGKISHQVRTHLSKINFSFSHRFFFFTEKGLVKSL